MSENALISTAGYRMPAEWEPHAATWLSWPHNIESWPGRFDTVEPAFAKFVRALAASETVHINVNSADSEARAKKFLSAAGATGEIQFHQIRTDDAWCRDHGAIFLRREAADDRPPLLATDWRYNAWGGKYPHAADDAVAEQMAARLQVPVVHFDMVLEGGSLDVNGSGALLTTEACLLHPNRNPHLNRDQITQQLCSGLGVREVLWLAEGIVGDDTDGHIDDLARFVGEHRVVTVVERDSSDDNYLPLRENLRRLKNLTAGGKSLEVIELPMPPAIRFEDQRVPASYANFYIANKCILLPGYDSRTDRIAASVLGDLFPSRPVEVIDCRDLIWGLGAFHCLTQQIPRA